MWLIMSFGDDTYKQLIFNPITQQQVTLTPALHNAGSRNGHFRLQLKISN